MSFTKDFADANADFSRFKAELLSHIKGDLRDVEMDNSPIAKMFDAYCGVDSFQIIDNQVRGVAIRVQWKVNYKTFTIRYKRANSTKTEYEKRAEAILGDRGFIYPYLTIQAYLDKRGDAQSVLSCCIVKTYDLYHYIFKNFPRLKTRKCPEGNEFLFISFSELKKSGIKIILFGIDI